MKFQFTENSAELPSVVLVPVCKDCTTAQIERDIRKTYQIPSSFEFDVWQPDEKDYLIVFAGDKTLYLVGITDDRKKIICSIRKTVKSNLKRLPATVGVDLSFVQDEMKDVAEDLLFGVVNGAILGKYDIHLFKSKKEKKKGFAAARTGMVVRTKIAPAKARRIAKEAADLAQTQMSIFDLVNMPANKKKPLTLAATARKLGKASGFKVQVISGSALVKKGFHAIHAVGQAGPDPAALIIMEYKPRGARTKIALVGKGVTFDTGGVSLKPPANMHLMKGDMAGAAAVLGVMDVVAKRKLPVHLIGIVAAAENNIGSRAIKPGDVINSYSGKTIEVLNTDAEGRLVLADGLAFATKHYKPDVLIDLATLTGSIVRALGKYAAGLFTNDEELSRQLIRAGRVTGERLWPMPLWKEYGDELKTDIADIKNISSSPNAGSITAAKFLEAFINDHPKWAHLDIASQMFNDNEFSKQANATGFGISLLYEFIKSAN